MVSYCTTTTWRFIKRCVALTNVYRLFWCRYRYFLFSISEVVSACQNESGKKVNAPILLAICGFCAEKKEKKDSYLEIFCGYLYLTFAAAVSYKEGMYITQYYAFTRFWPWLTIALFLKTINAKYSGKADQIWHVLVYYIDCLYRLYEYSSRHLNKLLMKYVIINDGRSIE